MNDPSPVSSYLGRLASPRSRSTMRDCLSVVAHLLGAADAEAIDWPALRYERTQQVRSQLAARYAPATANLHLAALRGVLEETWRLGLMDAESYRRAADLASIRGFRLPAGRMLSDDELRSLLDVCRSDRTLTGLRDAALIAMLYAGGVRRSEIVAVTLADYDAATGELRIRRGKGRKERIVYVEVAAAEIARWLAARGTEPGALFPPIDRRGHVRPRALSSAAVLYVLEHRAAQARITHFSPHDLRRTCISGLLDAGVDLSIVQQLAGHANIQTTAKYDRRGEAAKRQAASRLRFPT
ncbi:MAG: tyrosine-type recombinase/integrase [Candidatus Xenobia bacterium]